MKIVIKTFLLLVIIGVLSGPALGIDRSKKEGNPQDQKAIKIEQKKPDSSAGPQDSQGNNTRKPPKNYDNFIDSNNNGIDDRAEKTNPKQTPDKPDSTTKKNPKP